MGRKVKAVMCRAPDGSSYIKCDTCKKNVPVGIADMHGCKDEMFAKTLAQMKADQAKRLEEQMTKEEAEKATKKEAAKKDSAKKEATKKKARDEAKSEAKGQDPGTGKKPPTAYMLFMEEYRVKFREENPDVKKITEATKAGAEVWNSMSSEEKKPYLERAADLKQQYKDGPTNPEECQNSGPHDQDEKVDSVETKEAEGPADPEEQGEQQGGATEKPEEEAGALPAEEEQAPGGSETKRRRLLKVAKEEENEDTAELEDDV